MKMSIVGRFSLTFLMLLTGVVSLTAQPLNFREADSLSQALWQNKDWNAMLAHYRSGDFKGLSFKNLHYRTGAAAFHTGRYNLAYRQFRKAYQYNKSDTYVREYLYWSLSHRDETELASYFAKNTPLTGIRYPKPIQGVYVEIGLKLATIIDSIRPLAYGSVMMSHGLSHRISILHGFCYLQQTYQGLPYRQPEYFISMAYVAGPDLILRPALHLAGGSARVENRMNTGGTPQRQVFELSRVILAASLEAQWKSGPFELRPAYLTATSQTDLMEQEYSQGFGPGNPGSLLKESDSNSGQHLIQYGLKAFYTMPLHHESFSVEAACYRHEVNSSHDWIYEAGLHWHPRPGSALFIEWKQAGLPFFLEENGRYLINTPAIMKQRYRLGGHIPIGQRFRFHLIASMEKMQEKTFNFDYYSLFAGLEISL